jgi:hypothetical protein
VRPPNRVGRSWFDCHNCEKPIRFANKFPFSFSSKVCGGCGWEWRRTGHEDLGPYVDDLTERAVRDIEASAVGRPTGAWSSSATQIADGWATVSATQSRLGPSGDSSRVVLICVTDSRGQPSVSLGW